MRRHFHRAITAVVAGLLAVAGLLMWPAAVGGRTSYVTTHGISMEPRFHTGDLAVVRRASSYRVGEVVAYHSQTLHTVVMHRIVDVDGAGHYVFRGDNNSWLDPDTPTRDQLVGKLVARIPHGGVWLGRLTQPVVIGTFILLLLIAGSGAAAHTTRRRNRRRSAVSRHAARSPSSRVLPALAPPLRVAAGATAALAVLGAALAAVTWTRPPQTVTTATATPATAPSMTFSYTASVPRSPAYDDTTVTAPEPVFRTLADRVDVHYSYRGRPGTLSTTAELSGASGWHSSIALAPATTVTGDRYDGKVSLDLTALDRRAQAAAKATGIPMSQVSVDVTTTVRSAAGRPFVAALPLTLTPQQLRLADPAADRTITDPAASTTRRLTASTVGIAGHTLSVSAGRRVAIAALLLAMLAAAGLLTVARRTSATSEAARIRQRWSSLLLPVHPVPSPAGRPVVDVTEFGVLAKLAERYGLLILHWSRAGVDTFVVQDDATTFRFRTGAPESTSAVAGPPVASQPDLDTIRRDHSGRGR